MDAIDLVREHFVSLGTKRIEVPEWKLTIYSTPVTLSEKNKLYRKSRENDMELLVDILILKASPPWISFLVPRPSAPPSR